MIDLGTLCTSDPLSGDHQPSASASDNPVRDESSATHQYCCCMLNEGGTVNGWMNRLNGWGIDG